LLRSPYTLGLFGRLTEAIFLYLFIREFYQIKPQKSRRHAVNNMRVISDLYHMTNGTNRTLARGLLSYPHDAHHTKIYA